MDQFLRDTNRDTVLVVNGIQNRSVIDFAQAITDLEKIVKRKLKVTYITEKRDKSAMKLPLPKNYTRVVCNTDSIVQLEDALHPYLDKALMIVCRSEKDIPYFRNIIPHVPYLISPTETSLKWANDKIDMRRRLRTFNKKISPPYTIVDDTSSASIDRIKRKVGFPLIVKPSGLAASVLVSVCYHEEELVEVLNKTFKKVKSIYKKRGRLTQPRILVEGFMEGDMYSTDVYVNQRGTMYTSPLVNIVTGFSGGQEDFFGYRQMTPVMLKPHRHQKAFNVAKEAVEALGLRSITAHVELMRTHEGWKVIEVNPRVGGFRDFLYKSVYNIDHTLNDLLIRLPMRPHIPRKARGVSAVLKMYAKDEGEIRAIKGLKKIQSLNSFVKVNQNLHKGDVASFARHGGGSLIDVYLHGKNRSDVLADIRRVEQILSFEVANKSKRAKHKLVEK